MKVAWVSSSKAEVQFQPSRGEKPAPFLCLQHEAAAGEVGFL